VPYLGDSEGVESFQFRTALAKEPKSNAWVDRGELNLPRTFAMVCLHNSSIQ